MERKQKQKNVENLRNNSNSHATMELVLHREGGLQFEVLSNYQLS